jgi:hypothetical protein
MDYTVDVMWPHEPVPFVRGVAFLDAGDPRLPRPDRVELVVSITQYGRPEPSKEGSSPQSVQQAHERKQQRRNANRLLAALPEKAHAAKGNSGGQPP